MFKEYFDSRGIILEGRWFCENLNLRLGSHFGIGNGPNLYRKSIEGFLIDLMNKKVTNHLSESFVEDQIINLSSNGLGKIDKLKFSYNLKNNLKKIFGILNKLYILIKN